MRTIVLVHHPKPINNRARRNRLHQGTHWCGRGSWTWGRWDHWCTRIHQRYRSGWRLGYHPIGRWSTTSWRDSWNRRLWIQQWCCHSCTHSSFHLDPRVYRCWYSHLLDRREGWHRVWCGRELYSKSGNTALKGIGTIYAPLNGIVGVSSLTRISDWSTVDLQDSIIGESLAAGVLAVPQSLWLTILKTDHVVLPAWISWRFSRSNEYQLTSHRHDHPRASQGQYHPC